MRNAEKIIDELIQEFAEEMPLVVIQKLGEIRKALTTEEHGQSSEAREAVGRAVIKVAKDHNVSLINIAMFPVSKNVTTSIHSSQATEKDIGNAMMQIPGITRDLAIELDKAMPGFKMRFEMMSKMQALMSNKITPEGLDRILGGILSKDG